MGILRKSLIVVLSLSVIGSSAYFGMKYKKISDIKTTYADNQYNYMKVVPTKLELQPIKLEEGKYTEVKKDSISYICPWSNGNFTDNSAGPTKVDFSDGKIILVPKSNGVDFAGEVKEASNLSQLALLRRLFGNDAMISNYQFINKVYSCSPNNLTLYSSFNEIESYKIALDFKKNLFRPAKEAYNFDNGSVKGFAFALDPSKLNENKKSAFVVEFYTADEEFYGFTLVNANEEELKYILSSIKSIK